MYNKYKAFEVEIYDENVNELIDSFEMKIDDSIKCESKNEERKGSFSCVVEGNELII